MSWLDDIYYFIADISDWFYDLYLTTDDWIYPFYLVAPIFEAISWLFWDLAERFAIFGNWVREAAYWISKILDFDTIKELLRDWLDWAEWAWSWVQNAWYYVTGWINDWWLDTQTIVKGWIEAATEGLAALRSAWDDFWTNILPNLLDFSALTDWWTSTISDVQDLINSAFTLREQLWAGWQELRDQVTEFFSDPWQWVYDRLDEFFERFW